MRPLSLKEHEEVVIFRSEYNPYRKVWDYVACFPDDVEDRDGSFLCLPLYINGYGDTVFPEGHCTMSHRYYLKTRPVPDDVAKDLCRRVQDYYDSLPDPPLKLVVRHKMFHGNGRRKR